MNRYVKSVLNYFSGKKNTFTVKIHEPLSDVISKTLQFNVTPWKPLCNYLSRWDGYSLVRVGKIGLYDSHAASYVPMSGDVIELFPDLGVKAFTNAYIERLNRMSGDSGRFLKAAIVTEQITPIVVKKYYVDNQETITFDGHEFTPLSMIWSGFEVSSIMSLATMTITIPNIGGEIISYIEEVDILENDVELLVIHTDLLSDPTAVDRMLLQVQLINADDNVAAFSLGINLGINDVLPRKCFTKKEFPGLVDDITRLAS